MAYTLNYAGGIITVVDGTLNNTKTSLSLPGRNYAGYGAPVDQNMVSLLENFAYYTASPPNPIKGQMWFDTTAVLMKYNIGTDGSPNWIGIAGLGQNVNFNNVTVAGNLTVAGTVTADTVVANTIKADENLATGVEKNINATGTDQGTARQLVKDINVVVSATTSLADGVKLPATSGGNRVTVMNLDASANLKVYPFGSAQINNLGSTIPYELAPGGKLDFVSIDGNQWYTLNATYS